MKRVRLTEKDLMRIVRETVNITKTKEVTNYMFFQNLKEIRDNIDTLLNMNESEVDQILSNGHDWATEHIATAKDDIEEVTNFLKYGK